MNHCYTIIPTLACNCNCSYCFETDRHNGGDADKIWASLSSEMSRRADRSYGIYFIGGETLLNPERLDWLLDKATRQNPGFAGVEIITNGTLITERQDIQAYLRLWAERYKLRLAFSIDGTKELHDKNRRFADGSPTWERAVEGYKWCRANLPSDVWYRLNGVLTRSSMNCLADGLKTLIDLEPDCVMFFPPDTFENWTAEDAPVLTEQLKRTIDYLAEKKTRTVVSEFLRPPYDLTAGCKATWHTGTAIGPDGYVSPCHRICCENSEHARSFTLEKVRALQDEICRGCDVRAYCNVCPAALWINHEKGIKTCWYGYIRARINARKYYRRKILHERM